MSLVQGRWDESFIPMVLGKDFENPVRVDGFIPFRQGLTLKYSSPNFQPHLYSLLDSLFSVSIYEVRNQEIELLDPTSENSSIRYLAKPYEAFCKENLSFFFKLLNGLLFDSGLKEVITQRRDIHTSPFKQLVVNFDRERGLSISFSLAFSSISGQNTSLSKILRYEADIKKCLICEE